MATKPLIDFLLAATKDNSLRDEVKDAANFDAIVKLAERRGYQVTSEDLGTAMGKFRWLTDDQLISEYGLEANQLEPIFGLFGLSASFPEHRELTDEEL